MGIASEWLTGHPGNLSERQADNYMSDMCVLKLGGTSLPKDKTKEIVVSPLAFHFLAD